MLGEIPAAIAAIKTSMDIFKTVNDGNRQTEINNVVAEITSRLNEILKENTNLIEALNQKEKAISLLEKVIAEADAKHRDKEEWALESLNYEAWNPMAGTTIYRRKPDDGVVGSLSNYCANCYESSKASTLSVKSVNTIPGIGPFIATLVCHTCKSSYLAPASKLKG